MRHRVPSHFNWSLALCMHETVPCTWSVSMRIVFMHVCRGQLKCDGTRAETRFHLSAKRTSPFKPAGASVQSTTGSRGVRISGYTMFRGSVKGIGYPLHSPISPSLPFLCVAMCHDISSGVYQLCLVYCVSCRPYCALSNVPRLDFN